MHYRCRARIGKRRMPCLSAEIDPTGRTRTPRFKGARIRQGRRKYQVKCRKCGSLGWSQHVEVERAFYKAFVGETLKKLEGA
jgi:hypothetical protein